VLVQFFAWFENSKSVFLAMEYLEHGDLAQHINIISTEEEVRQITNNLLDGLKIMHGEGFAHRDLKPQVCYTCMSLTLPLSFQLAFNR
jgi:serine/threonine protein kinase